MSVSTVSFNAAQSALQTRPALRLAVGQLPGAEQNLVQIAVRVLRPHLKVPCDVVTQSQADITIRPSGNDQLDVVTSHAERQLERPVRLAPLSDALSELITDLLDHEAGAPAAVPTPASMVVASPQAAQAQAAATAVEPIATPARGHLLDVLLTRDMAGPLRITLQSGLRFYVDERYHTAWIDQSPDTLPESLGQGRIVSIETITPFDFVQKTSSGGDLHSLLVEQICWMLPLSATGTATLERWHVNPDTLLELHTWPNLSRQNDKLPWLSVLAAIARRPMSMAEALRLAEREDIATARARVGLGLLLLFKHASQRQPDAPAPMAAPAAPVNVPSAAAQGLLGRLRSRLRSFVN